MTMSMFHRLKSDLLKIIKTEVNTQMDRKDKAKRKTQTTSYIVDEKDVKEEEEAVDLKGGKNIYETYNSAMVRIKEEPSSDGEGDGRRVGGSVSRPGRKHVGEVQNDDEEPVTNILVQEFSAIRNIFILSI